MADITLYFSPASRSFTARWMLEGNRAKRDCGRAAAGYEANEVSVRPR
jgi:hypothetical protein